MIPWNPQGAETITGGTLSPEVDVKAELTGLTIDSREAGPGVVFVALPGQRVDGIDFVDDAVRRGSPLAIVDREVPGPTLLVPDPEKALARIAEISLRRARQASPRLKVIGITGSMGKTTTKDLLAQITSTRGHTIASQGSFNNHLGVPLTVARV
ncbi:MAG: Mur ligase domain-containing protein, partial [Bifidobacteriaceae bacterium]|nr:Mur ligase domain-containing protein [Bifidobacteriaceae bacterium]